MRDLDDFDEPTPRLPRAREDRVTNTLADAARFERDREYDEHADRWGEGAPRRSELGRDER